jgi:anti-sigma-K factor RskA
VTGLHKRRTAQPWFRQPVGIAASFLLLLALSLGVFATAQNQRADRAEQTAAHIAAVATDPNRAYFSHELSSGGTGTVVVAGDRAIFRATGVTSLPGSHTYQLWIIDNKGAHSAGVLGPAKHGDIQQFVTGVKPTDQIGLTVEPKGGSKAPTTPPVVLLPVRA